MMQHLSARHKKSSPHYSAGQSLVEFALLLPFLTLLVVGSLDLGRIYFAHMSVVNAAREGARWGAGYPPTGGDCNSDANSRVLAIKNKARQEVDNNVIHMADLTVTVSCPEGAAYKKPIVVTVQYPYHLITAVALGGATIQLQGREEMEIFVK